MAGRGQRHRRRRRGGGGLASLRLRGVAVSDELSVDRRWWAPGFPLGRERMHTAIRVQVYETRNAARVNLTRHCQSESVHAFLFLSKYGPV